MYLSYANLVFSLGSYWILASKFYPRMAFKNEKKFNDRNWKICRAEYYFTSEETRKQRHDFKIEFLFK